MSIDVIGELFKKLLDIVPIEYFIPVLILILIYIKKQWVKRYLSALWKIKYWASLRSENIENVRNYLKIELSSISITSNKLKISYIVYNFSIFNVILYKLLENKVELSVSGISLELPKSDFQKEKIIQEQKNDVLEIERILNQVDISKIIEMLNKSKADTAPLILTVPITGYFRCKHVEGSIEAHNTCVFRVPPYDLNLKG